MKRWLLAIVALLLCGAGVYAWWDSRPDPQVVKVQELQKQLMSRETASLAESERRDLFSQMRQAVESLTPDQQRAAFSQRGEEFREAMERRLDEFFDLPPDQRTAALDKQIDEMESRRKEFETMMAQRQRNASGADAKSGPPRKGPQGAPGGSGAGPAGSRGTREERRKRMLDNSSPVQRAQMTEFGRLMRERMQQRGLGGGGGGPGGGRFAR